MRKLRTIVVLILCIAAIFAIVAVPASAATYRKTTTVSYSCKAHNNCHWVKFTSEGNTTTGAIYDKYFSGNSSHWPNAFKYDNVWSYQIGSTGYAKGTYTLYSSLITQWVSMSFKSVSRTITHTY